MRRPPFLSALLVLSLVARLASATEGYPPTIEQHLGLSYRPECGLCHLRGQTGAGTVVTPFGRAVRARGVPAEDASVLVAALERMRGERVDSDADGTPDVAELVAGTDPNLPPNDDIGLERYGCVGRVSPSADVDPVAMIAALAALGALARRRPRASRG